MATSQTDYAQVERDVLRNPDQRMAKSGGTVIGELSAEQVQSLLYRQVIGRIGCHAAGRTYVVPVSYVFDGTNIYGRTSEGLKLRMMRENPSVCFEVEDVESFASWKSVIAWGQFEELHGEEETLAMSLLINRFSAVLVSETTGIPRSLHGTAAGIPHGVVFRIRLDELTGRYEYSESDRRINSPRTPVD